MKSADFCILAVAISVILLLLYFFRGGVNGITSLISPVSGTRGTRGARDAREGFVAWNNEDVREGTPYGVLRDDERVKQVFNQIVAEDASKFQGNSYSNWKPTTWFEEDLKGITHYVLKTINLKGNRRFVALDHISTQKEQTMDPVDRQVVNRWASNLFIQEKSEANVHAWSMMIAFTLIQKGDVIKITELHTITDHFYKKPLVDGINPHDKYYKILNPFHLQKPWKTSGRVDGKDVLMTEEESERLLASWHKDLKTPQYRCFTDSGSSSVVASKQECDSSQGTWDQPVKFDNECPFYRANKHYPNRLGGVKLNEQRCEMPVNTKTIGYRHASSDPVHQPWCYNCKEGVDGPGSWGSCCTSQADSELYPELGGFPDYAYPGDELERYQQRDVLAQRGLNWQKYPTHVKNITNKNQRQPVFNAIVSAGPGKVNLP